MSKRAIDGDYEGVLGKIPPTRRMTRSSYRKMVIEDDEEEEKKKKTPTKKVEGPRPIIIEDRPSPLPLVPTKTSSLTGMNLLEMVNKLTSVVRGQDETMRKLAFLLYPFFRAPVGNGPLILPLLLSGVSGVGKTTTVKLLREMTGVNDDQFIRYPLTNIANEQQIDQILGAGPGLIGFLEMEPIPNLLMKAIGIQTKVDHRKKDIAKPTTP